jgi:hypothetical protein
MKHSSPAIETDPIREGLLKLAEKRKAVGAMEPEDIN